MLDFHECTPEAAREMAPLFRNAGVRACEYAYGTCYQWRIYCHSLCCAKDGFAFFRATYYDPFGASYLFPAGVGSIGLALDAIEADARERGIPLRLWVPGEDALGTVKAHFGGRIQSAEPIRDQFDYIYDIRDLQTFAGKKMHGQKNHLNRFLRENPDAVFVPVTPETAPEAEAFLTEYANEAGLASEVEQADMAGTLELLAHYRELGLSAGFIRTGRGVAAFSAGEVIGDTLFVHAEKARTGFSGAYQAIVAMYARYAAGEGVLYCNREDDSGDEGLRQSKLSYQPAGFIEKYAVIIGE